MNKSLITIDSWLMGSNSIIKLEIIESDPEVSKKKYGKND
jgi:hypothetical protein